MASAFDTARDALKRLPGAGFRSAERMALHLLVEHPEELAKLLTALSDAALKITRCACCGNLAERGNGENSENAKNGGPAESAENCAPLCKICANEERSRARVCVVEHIPDLMAIERSGTFDGRYHVLHGRLSPLHGIGPAQLNFASLEKRLAAEPIEEIILALSNDVEGEATSHFLREELGAKFPALKITRIGFGLPSGGALNFADPATLRSALASRRDF